jgi:hypothetical protein
MQAHGLGAECYHETISEEIAPGTNRAFLGSTHRVTRNEGNACVY